MPQQQKEPSIDFGTLPPPVMPRPQPINDWQNRETPKPSTVVPPPVTRDLPQTGGDTGASLADRDPLAELAEMAEPRKPASMPEPAVAAPAPAASAEAKPAAASDADPAAVPVDKFAFDFGIGDAGQGAVAKEPAVSAPPAQKSAGAQSPAATTGDPIADLIAAELDAGLSQPQPPQPQVQQAQVPQPQPPLVANPVSVPPRQSMEPRPRTSVPQPPQRNVPRVPAPAENDRFAVSPIFGPVSKGGVEPPVSSSAATPAEPSLIRDAAAGPSVPPPPVAQPAPGGRPGAPERDPMDEIESLIGEAVRVELVQAERSAAAKSAAQTQKPEPAIATPQTEARTQPPVVPPLTAGLPPRRAALKDAEPRVSSDEAAALTAAASATAPIGKKEARPPKPEPIPARPKPARNAGMSRGMRQYVGMAVAGTLLLASGLGLYWVFTMNAGTSGEAPVLQAEADPVKKEAPPAQSTSNGQGSVVFNELEGKSDTSQEQLVPRDDSATTPIADVAQPAADTAATGESELANRKVRTVTVRPDGSIVSGDEAGAEALPVDRPNVPSLPAGSGDTQATDLLAAVQNGTADTAQAATSVTTAPATDAAAQLAAIQPSPGNVIDPNIAAPVPMPRPSDRSQLNGSANGTASASNDAGPLDVSGGTAQAAPKVVSGNSGTYVQLSSQRTQDDAAGALRSVQRRLGSVVNGSALEIRRVDLGAKGIWYRVVLPTSSFQEATQTCATIKANGGDCVPING